MTLHKALHSRNDIDSLYMCQEKKEEKVLSSLNIASIHRYVELKTPLKNIPTIVGYLIANLVYTYILDIYDL